VRTAPAFQLYLQLYREQHAVLQERAVAAGMAQPLAACVANELFVWLHAQPALLADEATAAAYLFTTLDELVGDIIQYQQANVIATTPRLLFFTVLAAKQPKHFEKAIQQLPYPYRDIASLYYQGYSEREIASRVNIAFGIVKRRLSFSLYLLKTQFAKKPKAPV
jgi:DNA-directed RNA polymerase specialized sigma24 family protein